MADGKLRLVYAGALSPVYELDVAIDAVAALAKTRPDLAARLDLYGRDFAEVPLRERGEPARPRRARDVPRPRPDRGRAGGDRRGPTSASRRRAETPFTDFSLSTKIFEYGAMAKPVVASRLPMVERTFEAASVATYVPGSAGDLAAIPSPPRGRAARARGAGRGTGARVRELAWERESSATSRSSSGWRPTGEPRAILGRARIRDVAPPSKEEP